MSAEMIHPDWLAVGAEVIVSRTPQWGHTQTSGSRVASVAPKSFTVSDYPKVRFRLPSCEARPTNTSTRYRCIPLDSELGRREAELLSEQHRANKAVAAVDRWMSHRSDQNRTAAIAALQAIPGKSGGAS